MEVLDRFGLSLDGKASPTSHHQDSVAPSVMQPASTATSCPLLKIPPELRLLIYEKLFRTRKGELALENIDGSWYKSELLRRISVPGKAVALLTTCKKIYSEVKPILYANVQFTLCCTDEAQSKESSKVDVITDRPVKLLDVVKDIQSIRLQLRLITQDTTAAVFCKTLLPLVHAVNNASSARKLLIHLQI